MSVDLSKIQKLVDAAGAKEFNRRFIRAKNFRKAKSMKADSAEGDYLQQLAFYQDILLRYMTLDDRDLRLSKCGALIEESRLENDFAFFVKLGKVLSKKPRSRKKLWLELFSKIERFLQTYWAKHDGDQSPLCLMSQNRLLMTCRSRCKMRDLSEVALQKIWSRLGLPGVAQKVDK